VGGNLPVSATFRNKHSAVQLYPAFLPVVQAAGSTVTHRLLPSFQAPYSLWPITLCLNMQHYGDVSATEGR